MAMSARSDLVTYHQRPRSPSFRGSDLSDWVLAGENDSHHSSCSLWVTLATHIGTAYYYKPFILHSTFNMYAFCQELTCVVRVNLQRGFVNRNGHSGWGPSNLQKVKRIQPYANCNEILSALRFMANYSFPYRCQRQFAKYTCPTCNVPYCCLVCFRSSVHYVLFLLHCPRTHSGERHIIDVPRIFTKKKSSQIFMPSRRALTREWKHWNF